MNLWIIFITGLTTGGISCLAIQGGLLASIIANQKENEIKENKNKQNLKPNSFDQLDWLPVTMFLIAKFISHTILGFLLGLLGSIFTLSLENKVLFQFFVAIFMFASAMNLLNVHPIFRFIAFQPPKFLRKIVHKESKSKAIFAPFILGLFTIFVPCGITQAMEVLAINSGNPIEGALTMAAFVLGTAPLFAIIGIATAKLSETWHQKFLKFAAIMLIFMSLYSLNGILQVTDSPLSFQKIQYSIANNDKDIKSSQDKTSNDKVQKVTIEIQSRGYKPNKFTVKAGIPVELTLISNGVYSCALDFTFREFNIRQMLKSTDKKVIKFTPTKKGRFTYSCSMGMYSGIMEVI